MDLISKYISQRWQNGISIFVMLLSFMVSILFVATAIIDYGFELDAIEMDYIAQIYKFVQHFFVILYLARLITNWRGIWKHNFVSTIVLGVMLLVTIIPEIVPAASAPVWLARYYHAFTAKFYILAIVGIFSLMEISRGIVSITRRRTNPALLLASTFLVIIFFGTILLMVPRSTLDGVRLSLIDALFVSTSAVCVTGLSPVDLSTTLSTEGFVVLALLIQIGGMGVMTITSFFALFFMGNTKLYDQFALKDMVFSDTLSSLMTTLLYVLGFTLGIEAIGAVGIWLSVHGTLDMTLYEEVLFSLFHSVSAFCNAGFSTISGNLGNPMLLTGHNSFYLIISGLIFLGGIGFPILVNFKNILFYHIGYLFKKIVRRQTPAKYPHLTRLNTKIALTTTIILIIGGSTAIALLEWNGAFDGFTISEKLSHSLFNAISPRTAGFNSVDLTKFSLQALMFYVILMWIGGASQSTAGGIKVNTIGVAFASFRSVVRGEDKVIMFNREITDSSVKRAYATIFGSVMVIICFFVILMFVEPDIEPFHLFFECISAIGTVGSSLGATPLLSTTGKIIISLMMFTGRLGIITVMMSLFSRRDERHYRLPQENVIIN